MSFFSKIKKTVAVSSHQQKTKKKHYKCLIEDLNKNISLNDAICLSVNFIFIGLCRLLRIIHGFTLLKYINF